MDLGNFSYSDFESFFLIFLRVGVILFILPFFRSRVIPALSKVGLTLIITILLYPVTPIGEGVFPDTGWGMAQLIFGELLIGMILGLSLQLFFEGVRMMGHLVGFQTGFAISNILDPQTGTQVSVFANMAYWVAILLFLLLNGHHILLSGLRESFTVIPLGSVHLGPHAVEVVMGKAAEMFVIALKIGAPAIAALLFTKVAFGLVIKLMPQMNIMIVAFPVQIVIGLLFFGISFNLLLRYMERYLTGLKPLMINTMAGLNG